MDIMVELDFAMFEFKMSFGEYCSRAPIPLTPIVKKYHLDFRPNLLVFCHVCCEHKGYNTN